MFKINIKISLWVCKNVKHNEMSATKMKWKNGEKNIHGKHYESWQIFIRQNTFFSIYRKSILSVAYQFHEYQNYECLSGIYKII